jgi:two-component system, cell cycle response regulator DivK
MDTSPKTILVVDDEELNLKLLRYILTREGYRVISATSAEEGLELLKIDPPDLVLMDIRLAGMDGLEAARRIKLDPASAPIPIIAVSAYAMEEDFQKAARAGCDAYLAKPFTRREIVDMVRKFTADGSRPP